MEKNSSMTTQGRRQKIFRGGRQRKSKTENSTIKPSSTLSKIMYENPGGPTPLPTPIYVHYSKAS